MHCAFFAPWPISDHHIWPLWFVKAACRLMVGYLAAWAVVAEMLDGIIAAFGAFGRQDVRLAPERA